jgi:hypothetical protein
VQFTIHVPFLLNPGIISPPEVFEIYKICACDVVSDVSESSTTEKCFGRPYCTWRNVTPRWLTHFEIVVNEKLVKIRPFHVLEAFVCPQFRECCYCFVVLDRCHCGVEAAVYIGKEIESPDKLEEGVVFGRPVEWFGIYSAATIPT